MLSWELYGLSVRYAHQDNSNLVVLVNKLSSRSWDSTLLSSSFTVDVLSLLILCRPSTGLGMVAISIRRSVVCCVYGPACPSIRVLSFSLYKSDTNPPVYVPHQSSCIRPTPVLLYRSDTNTLLLIRHRLSLYKSRTVLPLHIRHQVFLCRSDSGRPV